MSLQQLEKDFIIALQHIYKASEAKNIFGLAIESLTGINLKVTPSAKFVPDGCFTQMLGDIEKRLKQYEPVQYILNEAWFYDIPFYVDKNVLIPRPETEELVDWIIKDHKTATDLSILDIGTGSGCIPVTLKRKLPFAKITSCDISAAALKVASKNAVKYKTDIDFIELDFLNENLWGQLPRIDLIVSNPPYIPQDDSATMHSNVLHHEPHSALFVDNNQPLVFYKAIADAAKLLLKPEGSIYVEIYEGLGEETEKLFEDSGFDTILRKDMQGKNRMIKCITMH